MFLGRTASDPYRGVPHTCSPTINNNNTRTHGAHQANSPEGYWFDSIDV